MLRSPHAIGRGSASISLSAFKPGILAIIVVDSEEIGLAMCLPLACYRVAYCANKHGWTPAAFHLRVNTLGAGVWLTSQMISVCCRVITLDCAALLLVHAYFALWALGNLSSILQAGQK